MKKITNKVIIYNFVLFATLPPGHLLMLNVSLTATL